MFDLTKFSLQDMSEVGDALQQLELKAKNIDELSDMMVRYFFDSLVDTQTGEKAEESWCKRSKLVLIML